MNITPCSSGEGPRCSHSLSLRLSKKLAILTMVVIGSVFVASWFSISMLLKDRNAEDLAAHCELVKNLIILEARTGGEAAVLARLRSDAAMRSDAWLEVHRADGRLFYADAPKDFSPHTKAEVFEVSLPQVEGGLLRATYRQDFEADARMGRAWALVLTGLTFLAGAIAALGTWVHTQRQLRPLASLAQQTRGISAKKLDQRLTLEDPAEELLPWVEQFNALMARLERAYSQLDGFNADVAHELRTPLAALIGHTELALSRERSNEQLRETMEGNLEELQRLSSMVNDMLFLASADRGAQARLGAPVSLAELSRQVVDFHEAPLEDAGLGVTIEGDAELAVDEPLIKRALSNLLGNATRYAEPGSTVTVRIALESASDAAALGSEASTIVGESGAAAVRLEVENKGPLIEAENLPRIFDRFFRADSARNCPEAKKNHGLGLAIVAAIARMHAGEPLAQSQAGWTRVGLRLPLAHKY